MTSDINSTKHRQWFYFSVNNMVKGKKYEFNIVNLDKPGSIYNEGCKPAFYSVEENRQSHLGWRRATASNICYYPNAYLRKYENKFISVCHTDTKYFHQSKNNFEKTLSATKSYNQIPSKKNNTKTEDSSTDESDPVKCCVKHNSCLLV